MIALPGKVSVSLSKMCRTNQQSTVKIRTKIFNFFFKFEYYCRIFVAAFC